jgi:hypothetical protein
MQKTRFTESQIVASIKQRSTILLQYFDCPPCRCSHSHARWLHRQLNFGFIRMAVGEGTHKLKYYGLETHSI